MREFPKQVCRLLAGIALGSLAIGAMAQGFPNRPLRIIVPNTPGSSSDNTVRFMSPEFAKHLGQPVIVENRPGANSIIGSEYVAKQLPADGYTLLLVSVTGLASLPVTAKDLRFDPLNDLPPVIGLTDARFVWGISSTLPWKSFAEQVAAARASPGKLNWGSGDAATRLLAEAVIRELALDVVYIPYPTPAPFTRAVIGGEIQMSITAESAIASAGERYRILAVTGTRRQAPLLDVPTFAELGFPRIPGLGWSLNVRAGTPKAEVDKLYAAASQALKDTDVVSRYEKLRMEVNDQPPPVAARRLADTARLFAEMARKVGLQPE